MAPHGSRRSGPPNDEWTPLAPRGETSSVLIAQLSDVHVGGSRYREELLRTAIEEVNRAEPDLVVVAGDLTDDGYPDQYPLAAQELAAIGCPQIVRVPGNHDARNVGYLRYEDAFGATIRAFDSSALGRTWRSSRWTPRSRISTRERSAANTTAG
jgi:3',5'-cyclic AMP phosphodiesterase CpdA